MVKLLASSLHKVSACFTVHFCFGTTTLGFLIHHGGRGHIQIAVWMLINAMQSLLDPVVDHAYARPAKTRPCHAPEQ